MGEVIWTGWALRSKDGLGWYREGCGTRIFTEPNLSSIKDFPLEEGHLLLDVFDPVRVEVRVVEKGPEEGAWDG